MSHGMPSLKICCPYPAVFSGETERFPSSIDGSIPPDNEKKTGDESPRGPLSRTDVLSSHYRLSLHLTFPLMNNLHIGLWVMHPDHVSRLSA
jgi:hypothetical protein